MWISRKMINKGDGAVTEEGRVLSAEGASLRAGAEGFTGRAKSCLPYGYRTRIPKGEQVLLLTFKGEAAAMGTTAECASLPVGEIELVSRGGARIHLKNDGSIVFNNALTVTGEGEIIHGTENG
jgi:hypothetical protein